MSQKNRHPRFGTARRHSGFTLLEVLVSIAILSLGMLGVAALQGVGLRASSSAAYRSQAAWLATQMIEDARARRALVVAVDNTVVGAVGAAACGSAPPEPINVWRARIACALPSGMGGVQYNPITQRLVVTVQWDDSRGVDTARSGGNAASNFVLQTVL